MCEVFPGSCLSPFFPAPGPAVAFFVHISEREENGERRSRTHQRRRHAPPRRGRDDRREQLRRGGHPRPRGPWDGDGARPRVSPDLELPLSAAAAAAAAAAAGGLRARRSPRREGGRGRRGARSGRRGQQVRELVAVELEHRDPDLGLGQGPGPPPLVEQAEELDGSARGQPGGAGRVARVGEQGGRRRGSPGPRGPRAGRSSRRARPPEAGVAVDGVRLARPGLPVREHAHVVAVDRRAHQRASVGEDVGLRGGRRVDGVEAVLPLVGGVLSPSAAARRRCCCSCCFFFGGGEERSIEF